jgi:hypothetical protein
MILAGIINMLVDLYDYKPNQIQVLMGDKCESYKNSFESVDEQEFETNLIKLLNEYLSKI